MSDKQDQAICKALATDADLNRVLDDKLINLPDPPEPPPGDHSGKSLAELLDDLVHVAEAYYVVLGPEEYAEELAAARARVDAAIAEMKAALERIEAGT